MPSSITILFSSGAGAGQSDITKACGWVVLAFAVLAWYHAAGDAIAATFGRNIRPVGQPPVR
jgi:succinate-acetate transporter protein